MDAIVIILSALRLISFLPKSANTSETPVFPGLFIEDGIGLELITQFKMTPDALTYEHV